MEMNQSMLEEHQSFSPKEDDIKQSPEEKKAVKLVEKLFEQSKRHREKYDYKWPLYHKMFRGKQWEEDRPSYRHSEVINLVFQAIQSIIPILTDARPRISYLPQEPSDLPFSQILNQIIDNDWTRNNWLYQVTEVLYDSHFYGTGFTHTGFDPSALNNLGNIKLESCDPFYCYRDPHGTDINVKSNYFIYAEPVSLQQINRKYPDKGRMVKGDIENFELFDKSDLHKIKFKSPTDNVVAFEGNKKSDISDDKEALLITCYIKDDSFIEEEEQRFNERTQTEEKVYIQKLKYPKGRKIVTASGILLEDNENPYDDGEFPYEKLCNYILPREFWGISEVENIESPQKIFNKLYSFALDTLTLMGNPIWIVDTSSGIDTDNLFNRPGLILEKSPGTEVRREAGVQIGADVFALLDRLKISFDDLHGANDITRGVKPAGVNAGIALQELQDAAQTRIRQKSRNMDSFLQDIGRHYLSRVFQFYSIPRIVRLTSDRNAQQYFKFHVEQIDDQKVAKVRRFKEADDGRLIEGEEDVYVIQGNFDVKVVTGSSLPFARTEKESRLLNFYDRGIIDAEEVLKASEYPNAELVLERVRQKQMTQSAVMSGQK